MNKQNTFICFLQVEPYFPLCHLQLVIAWLGEMQRCPNLQGLMPLLSLRGQQHYTFFFSPLYPHQVFEGEKMTMSWTWVGGGGGIEVLFKHNLTQFLPRPRWRRSCGKRPRLADLATNPVAQGSKVAATISRQKQTCLRLNVWGRGPTWLLAIYWTQDVVPSVWAVKLRSAPEGKQSSLGTGKVGQRRWGRAAQLQRGLFEQHHVTGI